MTAMKTAFVALLGLLVSVGWTSTSARAAPDEPEPDVAPASPHESGPAPSAVPVDAASAQADEPESEGPIYERGGLFSAGVTLALKVGGSFSQVFSELGAAFVPELELGVVLPFASRMLEVFVSGQWAAPTTEGTVGPDPRLPGDGMMRYDVTQQEVALTLGLRLRVPIASDLFRPHVALGARLYLLRTEVSGAGGGEPFGDNEETATEPGFFGALGGELFVGPGAILLEVQVGYAALDGYVMRDTNVGALNVMLGYRFFF